jgi:hypothetical protein
LIYGFGHHPSKGLYFISQLGNLIRMCEFRGINVFLELPKPKKLKVKLKLE